MGRKKYYINNNGGNMENFEKLLKVKDVAELIGTTESHVRSLVFKKKIPFIKIGGLVFFSPTELKEWLKENSFHTTKIVA